MDLADVQELIGHTSAKTTTERYAMAAPQKLMGALGALHCAWERARANIENQRVDETPRGRQSASDGGLGQELKTG